MRLTLGATVLICSAFACQAQPGPSEASLTESDFELAGVALGSSLVQAVATVGTPDSTRETQGPYGETLAWSFHPGLTLGAHPEGVHYISATSPVYPTPRGLSVGDLAGRIAELYGAPNRIDGGRLTYCEPTYPECIRFARFVVAQGVVTELVVSAPLD